MDCCIKWVSLANFIYDARTHICQINWTDRLWHHGLEVMELSPYSPYLTPTDFYLCGPTMQQLAVKQIATDADVKQDAY